MQGDAAVLDYLNFLLGGELAARDQYFIHARMYEEWGYGRLFTRIHHEMQDETEHANNIIARILLLGGKPQMQVGALQLGSDVPSMLQADLDVELRVQGELKKGIALCEEKRDFVTRNLLLAQLKDTEEDHAHWLQKQIGLIAQIGLPNYLQSQAQ